MKRKLEVGDVVRLTEEGIEAVNDKWGHDEFADDAKAIGSMSHSAFSIHSAKANVYGRTNYFLSTPDGSRRFNLFFLLEGELIRDEFLTAARAAVLSTTKPKTRKRKQ